MDTRQTVRTPIPVEKIDTKPVTSGRKRGRPRKNDASDSSLQIPIPQNVKPDAVPIAQYVSIPKREKDDSVSSSQIPIPQNVNIPSRRTCIFYGLFTAFVVLGFLFCYYCLLKINILKIICFNHVHSL
jgi:hypothetical protein